MAKANYTRRDTITKTTKLFIEAVAQNIRAVDGNNDRIDIYVSVTDEAGRGVALLKKRDFVIDTMGVPAGGANVRITRIFDRSTDAIQGGYHLSVKPIVGQNWQAGPYTFMVLLRIGFLNAQTLCQVVVPT